MSLQITPGADATNPFSQDGYNTNPIRFAVDGRVGGVFERLYYLSNNHATSTFSALTIKPVANTAKDIVNGVDGYSIKLKAGVTQPNAQEWATIDEGNTITMANLSDNLTFLPFWVRIEIPKGAPVDTITNTFLRASGTETI